MGESLRGDKDRRRPRRLWIAVGVMLVVVLTLSAAAGALAWQGRFQPAPTRVDLPSGTVIHRVNLYGSNAYFVETEAGVVLVDAGMPLQEEPILRALRRIGREGDLSLIYITHAHVDHYGSAAALHAATGAPVAVHRGDAETMRKGESPLGQIRDLEWVSRQTLPYVEQMLANLEPTDPDILLEDQQRLDEFGIDGYVLYTPGHTPGSSTLIVEDDYALAGDLVSATGNPHAQNSYAYSWVDVAASLDRLQELAPVLTFAGHGPDPIPNDELQTLSVNFIR